MVGALDFLMSTSDAAADRGRITRMADGDSGALAELYDAHGGTVYTLALRIVRQVRDAEEIVQEVFAQAWRQAGRYDPGRATVAGWLLMMTRARALDALRARQARPDAARPTELPELPSIGASQEAMLLTDEAVAHVRAALGALGDTLRVPLELAYYDGLSQSEIAARLNQPLGTIKTRMRTALQKLREALYTQEPR
jgi:RNA polymerase sigma-70 factor (ECF subfamily)